MSTPFYLQIECPACDHEIEYGLCVSALESSRTGHMVIPVEMVNQIHIRCPHCSVQIYTGELEVYTEGDVE